MFAIPIEEKAASSFQDVIDAIDNSGGSTKTWAGARINTSTALQQATVYACVRILSETIGTLPIKVQTKNADRLWVDSDHDVLELLDAPNDFQTQHDLISLWVSWMELSGNAYSYKVYGLGKVKILLPLQSTAVTPELTSTWQMKYGVTGLPKPSYNSNEIMHFRHFGTAGYVGLNPIQKLRHDIGMAQRAKEHASGVFANGAIAGQWIRAEGIKTVEAAREMQKNFDETYRGAEKAGKTKVLWGGAELEDSGMSAVDSQLLQLLKYEKEEIAALFGVPGFLVNSAEKNTTWGTGLEEITKSFMRFSLRPRIDRMCHTLKRELLDSDERKKTKFVFETDAFTLGSFKEVVDAVSVAIPSGLLNPNEGRTYLNLHPRPGGDVFRESPNSVPEKSEETTPVPVVDDDDEDSEENEDA